VGEVEDALAPLLGACVAGVSEVGDPLVDVDGGAVLGWPASGLELPQAANSAVVARQARRVDAGLLRCVTGVSPP
jgi:hypothetical protein